MIRSSKHNLTFANTGKISIVHEFLKEYRACLSICIDYIWNLKTENFNIQKDLLKLPLYLDYKQVNYNGKLSARAVCSALEQAINIVRSVIKKRSQLLWVLNKLKNSNKPTEYIEKQLTKHIVSKPNISKDIPADLSSKCVDLSFSSKTFDVFIRIKSSGYKHISLPINYTNSFKERKQWKTLGGVSISEKYIILRQEIKTPVSKKEGKIVGADTGIKSIVTLSDGQSSKADTHGHTLENIIEKLERKQKNSKSFKRAQEHRKNFINWSINQLNLSNVKEIRLEKINTFTGSRNRKLSHFSHGLISKKLIMRAEESGVQIIFQSCTYKSQRCSRCSMVRKANRKGKIYNCINCSLIIDADLNAAINNSINLPLISFVFRQQEINRKGFFWKPEGFYDLAGQELVVPDTNKSVSI